MAVGIGNLDRRIAIQNYTVTKDGYGADIKTYAALITCWAKVRVDSGAEGIQAEQEIQTRTVTFTVRYYSAITEDSRIVYDGKNYDIISLAEVGRRNYLDITAKLRSVQ